MPNTDRFLADRRKHPRHPIEAEVTALFSGFWSVGQWCQLVGWTHNLSEGGVCFSLPYRIPDDELVLHIDYEGMGAEFVLVSVVEREDCQEDGWKYHCRIERTLSSIDALGCILEETFVPEGAGPG